MNYRCCSSVPPVTSDAGVMCLPRGFWILWLKDSSWATTWRLQSNDKKFYTKYWISIFFFLLKIFYIYKIKKEKRQKDQLRGRSEFIK